MDKLIIAPNGYREVLAPRLTAPRIWLTSHCTPAKEAAEANSRDLDKGDVNTNRPSLHTLQRALLSWAAPNCGQHCTKQYAALCPHVNPAIISGLTCHPSAYTHLLKPCLQQPKTSSLSCDAN